MFNLSIEGYCSSKLSEENFIDEIGDSNENCSSKMVNFPLNSRIIYKPVQNISYYYFVDIKVFLNKNGDKCRNINVFVKLNENNGKMRICQKIQADNLLCKFLCKIKEIEEIHIFLKNYPQKFCDIQLKSKTSLINVCI